MKLSEAVAVLLMFAALVWLVSSSRAHADELYFGAWSHHLKSDGLNEEHNLIAYSTDHWIIGRFRNSFDRESYLLARRYLLYRSPYWEGTVNVGIVAGYVDCDGELPDSLCPMIYPELAYTRYRIQPSVVLFGEALTLTFRVRF